MRGKFVDKVGDFKVYEKVDEKGAVIGYIVISPDGTVSEVFDSIDGAMEHARKLRKDYDPGLTF